MPQCPICLEHRARVHLERGEGWGMSEVVEKSILRSMFFVLSTKCDINYKIRIKLDVVLRVYYVCMYNLNIIQITWIILKHFIFSNFINNRRLYVGKWTRSIVCKVCIYLNIDSSEQCSNVNNCHLMFIYTKVSKNPCCVVVTRIFLESSRQ